MFQRLVVPLDGSKYAERAILVAARIARVTSSTIIFVRAVLPPVDLGKYAAPHTRAWERHAYENERAESASYLASLILKYARELDGIDVEVGVATGIAHDAICSVAEAEQADLIVMCSRGEKGLQRWLFGSVTQEVARKTSVPLLALYPQSVVMPVSCQDAPLRTVVVLDGSSQAESALLPAATVLAGLAAPGQGILHLLRVVGPSIKAGKSRMRADTSAQERAIQETEDYLKMIANRVRQNHPIAQNLAVTWSFAISTDVTRAIIQQVESARSIEHASNDPLLAVARERRKGFRSFLKGDILESLTGSTQLPLLLVPLQAPRDHIGVRGRKGNFSEWRWN